MASAEQNIMSPKEFERKYTGIWRFFNYIFIYTTKNMKQPR